MIIRKLIMFQNILNKNRTKLKIVIKFRNTKSLVMWSTRIFNALHVILIYFCYAEIKINKLYYCDCRKMPGGVQNMAGALEPMQVKNGYLYICNNNKNVNSANVEKIPTKYGNGKKFC